MRRPVTLVVAAVAALGGCTTVERNQVALGLCSRTAWCTTSEHREPSGPPQVRAMDQRKDVYRSQRK